MKGRKNYIFTYHVIILRTPENINLDLVGVQC